MSNWIPVSERLPEYMDVVLITNQFGSVMEAQYTGDRNYFTNGSEEYSSTHNATAWQPLPPAYDPSAPQVVTMPLSTLRHWQQQLSHIVSPFASEVWKEINSHLHSNNSNL